ncbi:DUF2703 domain-containing protein, partial [candidate division KSB1 bacterium]|nr:DUF2703 domain-containing protein [candidate division KSB1 bacterium]
MNRLEIEWRHLEKDGNTCLRCSETGAELDTVIAQLAEDCRPKGWEIFYKETKLTPDELAQSNLILLNGIPIENILPNSRAAQSLCPSCCDFTGK